MMMTGSVEVLSARFLVVTHMMSGIHVTGWKKWNRNLMTTMTIMVHTVVMAVMVVMAVHTVVAMARVLTVLLQVTTVVQHLTVLLQATRLHHLHQHQLKVVSRQLRLQRHSLMARLLATTVLATKQDCLVKAEKSPRKRAFLLPAIYVTV
jgi:hypothetical protein